MTQVLVATGVYVILVILILAFMRGADNEDN